MTLREAIGLTTGNVIVAVRISDGGDHTLTYRAKGKSCDVRTALEWNDPALLDLPVVEIFAENSPLKMGAGSVYNDGQASTVFSVRRRNIL